jgi:hypothetical protein
MLQLQAVTVTTNILSGTEVVVLSYKTTILSSVYQLVSKRNINYPLMFSRSTSVPLQFNAYPLGPLQLYFS